jgi:hypothetical protein
MNWNVKIDLAKSARIADSESEIAQHCPLAGSSLTGVSTHARHLSDAIWVAHRMSSVEVSAYVLVQEAPGEVLGVSAGAGGSELLVSVQGDGVLAFDAVKQVRCRPAGVPCWLGVLAPAPCSAAPGAISAAKTCGLDCLYQHFTNKRLWTLALQRRVRSWALGSRRRLGGPAVYDTLSQHYYAAVASPDGQFAVVAFNAETASPLDELRALVTPVSGVRALYAASPASTAPAPQSEHDRMDLDSRAEAGGVVVVSGDGSLQLVSPLGREVASLPAPAPGARFVEASACGSDTAEAVTIALVTGARPGAKGGPVTHTLSLVAVSGGALELVGTAVLPPPQADCHVISVASTGRRSAAIMWSSGTWEVFAADAASAIATRRHARDIGCFRLDMPSREAVSAAAGAPAPRGKKRAVAAPAQANGDAHAPAGGDAMAGVAMATVGNYTLLLGALAGSPPGDVLAAVVDTHYAAVHAATVVAPGCGAPPFQAHCVTLSAARGQQALVAAAWSSRVLLLRVQAPPVTLASVLGSATSPAAQRVLTAAELQQAGAVQSDAAPVWRGTVVGHAQSAVLASRVAADAVWDLSKMSVSDNTDAARVEKLTGAGPAAQETAATLVQQLAGGSRPSSRVVAAAVRACLRDGLWPTLERIAEAGLFTSTDAAPELVPALVAAKQYGALRAFLVRARDVSPPDLEASLVAALEVDAEAGQHNQALQTAAAASLAAAEVAAKGGRADAAVCIARARALVAAVEEFPASQALLLHAVIAARRDDGAAAAAAAALSVDQVLTLLAYLNHWLRLHRGALGSDPGVVLDTSSVPGCPTLAQCISWTSTLVDAHFSRLVMHDSGAALLGQLAAAVKTHVSATSALAHLDGVVRHLADGRPLPAPAGTVSALYSIERMIL